jgi:hypothetical protein
MKDKVPLGRPGLSRTVKVRKIVNILFVLSEAVLVLVLGRRESRTTT